MLETSLRGLDRFPKSDLLTAYFKFNILGLNLISRWYIMDIQCSKDKLLEEDIWRGNA